MLAATGQSEMGSIDIIKPLSSVIISAINKSQQHQEKNSWEYKKITLWLLGEKQICCLCAMQHLNDILN